MPERQEVPNIQWAGVRMTPQPKKTGRPKTIEWREAERLADLGVESEDIVTSLGVPLPLQKDPAFQARLAGVVELGHARHRIAVARRLEREGVKKGKPHSLLALARARLKFDQQ